MTLTRRSLIRLGFASAVAAGGGVWIVDQLGRASPDAAESLAAAPGGWTPWSQLTRLVDRRKRGAYPVHAILTPSGQVLMIGGAANSFFEFRFDPASAGPQVGVEPLTLPMELPDDYLECAGHAYLADGRLLVAGGSRTDGDEEEDGLDYAMLFDPGSENWERVATEMAGGRRWYPAVTRLPDSRLLVTSGFFDFGEAVNRSVELFDPGAYDAGLDPWTELISNDQNEWEIDQLHRRVRRSQRALRRSHPREAPGTADRRARRGRLQRHARRRPGDDRRRQ